MKTIPDDEELKHDWDYEEHQKKIEVELPLYEQRMNLCKSCECLRPLNICQICGCFMPVKTRMSFATCPIDKW